MKKITKLMFAVTALVTAIAFSSCNPNIDEPTEPITPTESTNPDTEPTDPDTESTDPDTEPTDPDTDESSSLEEFLINEQLVFTYNIWWSDAEWYNADLNDVIPADKVLKVGDKLKFTVKGVCDHDIEDILVSIPDNTDEGNSVGWVLVDEINIGSVKANEPFEKEFTFTIQREAKGTGRDSHRILFRYKNQPMSVIFKDVESIKTRNEVKYKLTPLRGGAFSYSLDEPVTLEKDKYYLIRGTIQVDEPSYGELNTLYIQETKTWNAIADEWALINSWSGRPIHGDEWNFVKIWKIPEAKAGVHRTFNVAGDWKNGDTDEKTQTATANVAIKKLEFEELDINDNSKFVLSSGVDNDSVYGDAFFDLDTPITVEAGKTYKVSGRLDVGTPNPNTGKMIYIDIMNKDKNSVIGDWRMVRNYETGLYGTQNNFSGYWKVPEADAGEIKTIKYGVHWDKTTELGILCTFDLVDFKIEELPNPDNMKNLINVTKIDDWNIGGDVTVELESPIVLEQGKTYTVSGTLNIGTAGKGNPNHVEFMDGNWRYQIINRDFVISDYENGLNNTQTPFSKIWTAEVSEELTKINIFLYWSKNFAGNSDDVLGSYCFLDLVDFKIEEIVYPENFDKYSFAINSNEDCIFSYDIYDSPYPITIEADKIYKITGKVNFDKSEKGNPTEFSINCDATDLGVSFASEKCPNDENGLNNKSEEEFELVYIFSNSGEITKFQYRMYWSKELDGNTDDVIGSLCFFKIVDFNVEELDELPQE